MFVNLLKSLRYVIVIVALPASPAASGQSGRSWMNGIVFGPSETGFSHSALDIKTVAMLALQKPYREATKKNMPRRWFGDQPHTHVALDDAIGQGLLLCNMLKELAQLRAAQPGEARG